MSQLTTDIKSRAIFLLGYGGVGRALTRQIISARENHATRNRLRLNVIGIADSGGVMLAPDGLSDRQLNNLLEAKMRSGRMGVEQVPLGSVQPATEFVPGTIVVDTTASDAPVPFLMAAMRVGCGVVLANKLPMAGDLAWYDTLSSGPARWETTVGAALPVISTVRTLLDSDDEIRRIEGSLSGTLGFIASQLEAGVLFGDAVRDARQRGYTEPDPRQDLGGLDAARKALILARMIGYRLSMSEVQVESLYPAEMDYLSVEAFLREVDTLNPSMAERARALTRDGKKLRYAATVENGQCRVGLVSADPASKLGGIRTSDSIVVFTTKFYNENPLAISGRGAGQEVTASGVLGDIVGLLHEMS
jgi:homoserine dehydrogenase